MGKWKRRDQVVLITTFVTFSWLGMQAVHELGHVTMATITGGQVSRVVLSPLAFSRTDVAPNPRPLLEVWAGPMIGAALPLVAYLVAALLRSPGLYLFRFFAGFCLVANGVYIGAGSFQRVADAGDLLRYGASPWQLWFFGFAAAPLGIYLWNGIGSGFGLGDGAGTVSRRATVVSFTMLLLLVVGELLFAGI